MKAIPAALMIAASLGTPAVAQSYFVSMAEAELPAESLDLIQSRIAAYSTFGQLSPGDNGIAEHRTLIGILAAAAIVGPLSPASAPALSEDRAAAIDATEAREFPQAVFDRIVARLTAQTTFQHISPEGVVRWSPRTIKLIEFVKVPSPTYPDTYLYAMRYAVSVLSEKEALAVYQTSCQVVVVYRNGEYSEPTVACAPLNLDQEGDAT